MTRNYLADYDLIPVSANLKETALNTEQTLDTLMRCAKATLFDTDPRREDNADELTGKEEPDHIYSLGYVFQGPMEFPKAQPQHFAFGYSYGLGVSAPSVWGTGYKHLITPISAMLLPHFTLGRKLGATIEKKRFASVFIDTLTSTWAKDSWAKLAFSLKGTGKFTSNIYEETVNAAYNATSLTLAANGVQGADAPARLDSVHLVRCQVPTTGEWKDVVVTAASGATPAVLTIEAPGGVADLVDYKILYVPIEAAWCTFPSYVEESPLRVTDLIVKIGGKWSGTAILGGHTIDSEVNQIEHVLNNQILIEYRVGGTGDYANYGIRLGRKQTLSLDRQLRDYILNNFMDQSEYFAVYMKATGDEFETGKNYYVEKVFPRCSVLKAPLKLDNGKILGQVGDLEVLEDATYGSARVEVANKVPTYAG